MEALAGALHRLAKQQEAPDLRIQIRGSSPTAKMADLLRKQWKMDSGQDVIRHAIYLAFKDELEGNRRG